MSRMQRIEEILRVNFTIEHIYLDNESYKHDVDDSLETHIKIIIVSEQFIDLSRIMRHRLLHDLLQKEFKIGLHALSLHLYTNAEWSRVDKSQLESPACIHEMVEKDNGRA